MYNPSVRALYRSPAGAAVFISILSVLAYAAWTLISEFEVEVEQFVSSLLLIFLELLFALSAFHLAIRKRFEFRLRRAWLLFSIAGLCNMLGDGLWFYYETFRGVNPFLSSADLLYGLSFPFYLAGVFAFPSAPEDRQERNILGLDLGIVLVSAFLILWYFILARIELSVRESLGAVVAIFYPAGGLLLVAAVVSLIQQDAEKTVRKILWFLAAGMFLNALADGLFAYYEVNATFYHWPFLNLLWMGSLICLLSAAAWQSVSDVVSVHEIHREFTHPYRLLRHVLPYLAIIVGMILLVLDVTISAIPDVRMRGMMFGTIALSALVVLRQYAVLRENIRLYNEMQRIAVTDALTGVYNRHFVNETLRKELERARRYSHSLSILLMDLDGFKDYNDRFGHLRGDAVLKEVAHLLGCQLRSTDILARFGGDEFLAILPETDLNGAQIAAGKIQKGLESVQPAEVPVGISIGVACFHPGISIEQLIEEADQDLYRKKSRPL